MPFDVKVAEPLAMHAPRSSSYHKASGNTKQIMVKENDDSISNDDVIVLNSEEIICPIINEPLKEIAPSMFLHVGVATCFFPNLYEKFGPDCFHISVYT